MAEPPVNGGYLIAAYVVVAVVLVGYAIALWRRASRTAGRHDGK